MHDYENSIFVLNNRKICLTELENEILDILLENKRRLVTYKMLSKKVYNIECNKYVKACIAGAIYKLRQKDIEIATIEKLGYMIV